MNEINQTIDQFTYQEDFHFSLLKNREGVSLEKISPSLISDQKESWHSASSEVGYATPGYRNSQFLEITNQNELITIEPAVFTPNQDGNMDFTTISYHLPQPGYIGNCWIVNIEGIKIKFQHRALSAARTSTGPRLNRSAASTTARRNTSATNM